MGSNVNLGSFEVTEATVSRSVSRSSLILKLTWLYCVWKSPDFVRPLIGHVINSGEDLLSPHPMRATSHDQSEA